MIERQGESFEALLQHGKKMNNKKREDVFAMGVCVTEKEGTSFCY